MSRKKQIDPVVESLEEMISIRKQRNGIYNDVYKRKGEVIKALFGGIPQFENEDDLNKFGVLNIMISKMMRITETFFNEELSEDSIDDLAIYGQMLKELYKEK